MRQFRHVVIASLLGLAGVGAFPAMASAFTPYVVGVSASATGSGATLNATIYPYGSDTHYRFEYGTTTAYGTNVPIPDGDVGSAAYPGNTVEHQTVSGLTSGTTYHYRVVASNAEGGAFGEVEDHQFTTIGPPPTVEDEDAVEVSGGFELKGTVNPNGTATTYQFEYGTTAGYGSKIPVPEASVGSGTVDVPVSQTVTSLLANTTYHFRLLARNPGNTAATADRTFTTPTAPPSAPTAEVNAPQATANGYELRGAVNPDSLETTYHFELGTSTSYGTNLPEPDATLAAGSSAVAVSREVTDLLPNTTYHYRIVAANSEGQGVSGDESFTTPPLMPAVVSLPASESAEGFTLNGTVNPNGGATTYHFDFGVTEAYGQNIPVSEASAGAGTSSIAVSQLVEGLPPGVPYHYRLVAHNAGGTSVGEDEFFVTPLEPEEESSAAGSSGGGSLSPPTLAPPSNAFTTRAGATRGGRATLRVRVPGPGTISASGKLIKAVHAIATGAGTVSLKLKLTGAGKKAIKRVRRKRLRVELSIVFRPLGGSARVAHRTIVFR
jgi:hypothetical protein